MKAFAYLRVSGKDQVTGDGFQRQTESIRRYATQHGIKIVHIYREEAVCGATEWDSRPAWLEMLATMNGCRTIIIEKLDRLARDLMVQEHIIADLKKRNITLVSVHEPDLDSADPTRVLMRQIMGAISQYDKAMIVLKLRGARQRMKAKTGRCEGAKPYGTLPGEDKVLDEMKRMAAAGQSKAAIARELNNRGVMPRRGKAWHPYAVSRIMEAKQ
ncbi:MAG TPA: recombinase family protein [Bryobacteraceae bacterium]|nr:recombinase family protein [Bryobacteraceae bacterium]